MRYTIILMTCLFIALSAFTKKGVSKERYSSPPPDTIKISGTLSSYYYTFIDGFGNASKDSVTTTEFYPNPVGTQTTELIYAGNVSVNSNTLMYNESYKRYLQNQGSITMSSLTWSVSGNSTITPFSYSCTPLYPAFNPTVLPDTSTKASGITLSLGTITNTDPTRFICSAMLTQNNGAIQKIKTVNSAAINTNTVFFSSGDLSAFNTNDNIYILIMLQNYKYVTIGSKNYALVTSRYYRKESYLK